MVALLMCGAAYSMDKSLQFPLTELRELMKKPDLYLSTLPPHIARMIQLQVFSRKRMSRSQVIALMRDRCTYFAQMPLDIKRFVIYELIFGTPYIIPFSQMLSDTCTRLEALPVQVKTILHILVVDDDLAPILAPFGGSKELCLLSAVERGDTSLVRALLISGADPNYEKDDDTPLCIATSRGDIDIASMLLSAGANPNKMMSRESPPFICNLRENHPLVADLLLSKGASEYYVPVYHYRPLFLALQAGDSHMVEILLKQGTAVNTITYPAEPVTREDYTFGATALCVAAACCSTDIIRLLLAAGADASKPNAFGLRPVDIARKEGRLSVVEVLESSHGCKTGLEQIQKSLEELWKQ